MCSIMVPAFRSVQPRLAKERASACCALTPASTVVHLISAFLALMVSTTCKTAILVCELAPMATTLTSLTV